MKSLFKYFHSSVSKKVTYKPAEPKVAEKLKHKFVPCCETLIGKIDKNIEPFQIDPAYQQPKVVIVGAGLSGLSAAATLVNGGIKNLVILEAKERPGGRIHSCKLGEVIVEFGADKIEGGSMANSVYNLACMGGVILTAPKRSKLHSEHNVYVTTEGRILKPHDSIYQTVDEMLYEAAGVFTSKQTGLGSVNLNQFLLDKLKNKAKDLPEDKRHDFILITNGILNEIRARWGEDLSVLSLDQYGSHIFPPGGFIRVPRGAQSLLGPLLSEIPNDSIKYNKPVQCIRWGTSIMSNPRASVICCDGTEVGADYVICTVSLGVLKKQADKLFSPNLPEYKLNAIRSLGFGNVNRIFTEYAKPFWLKCGRSKFKTAWTTTQLKSRDNWVKGISEIEEVHGRGNVIMTTVSGKEAKWTEGLSNSQLAEDLTLFMRQITGDPAIPCPTNINRSKWATDVHFYGSRTFMKLGSLVRHICDLAVPLPGLDNEIPPVVLFAGEATSPGNSSTMHGARISGIREAHRIIALTIGFHGPPIPVTCKAPKIPPCESPCDSFYDPEPTQDNIITPK